MKRIIAVLDFDPPLPDTEEGQEEAIQTLMEALGDNTAAVIFRDQYDWPS